VNAGRLLLEKFRNGLERLVPVKIVGIDDSKRFANYFFRAQHGVAGAPGFGTRAIPVFGRNKRLKGLGYELDFDLSFQLGQKHFFNRIADFVADNEHDLRKPGPNRVK